jgi:hypothetical protein
MLLHRSFPGFQRKCRFCLTSPVIGSTPAAPLFAAALAALSTALNAGDFFPFGLMKGNICSEARTQGEESLPQIPAVDRSVILVTPTIFPPTKQLARRFDRRIGSP